MTNAPTFALGMAAMLVAVSLTAYAHSKGEVREQILRTAAAILINWIAGLIYVSTTDNYTPWHFSIFIDALAAFAVMFHPAGRVQGFVGLFYFVQIAGHIAFGLRTMLHMSVDPIYYYDAITYVAWAQLAAMGAWCGGVWIGDLLHRLRPRGDASDSRASAATSKVSK